METGSVYRIAYLGTCHGGDFDLATRMVSTAAQCGMQAIVIDLFRAEALAQPGIDSNYPRYKAAEFRPSQFQRLADMAREFGLDRIFHPRDSESLLCHPNQEDGLWTRTDSLVAHQAINLATDGGREIFLEAVETTGSETSSTSVALSGASATEEHRVVVMKSHSGVNPSHSDPVAVTSRAHDTETPPQILTTFPARPEARTEGQGSPQKRVVCQHFYHEPILREQWPKIRQRFQHWAHRLEREPRSSVQCSSSDAA